MAGTASICGTTGDTAAISGIMDGIGAATATGEAATAVATATGLGTCVSETALALGVTALERLCVEPNSAAFTVDFSTCDAPSERR